MTVGSLNHDRKRTYPTQHADINIGVGKVVENIVLKLLGGFRWDFCTSFQWKRN